MTIHNELQTNLPPNATPPQEVAGRDGGGDGVTNGAASAAILAAGIGCAALGVLVVLAEGVLWVKETLTFNGPVGPLSGKTIVAVAIWLLAWVAVHLRWSQRQVAFGKVWAATLALIAVGLLGTFPPFFQMFAHD